MEDGVKESNIPPPESKEIHKAGWLKKSSGVWGLWKDRYIQILKTQIHVFDNEDEQRCLETLELANYERCQDQRSFLKRKKHFNLIPSPGTKVQDVKFQARNAEERDVWIQALNDGINRGKNKVFDEVKVDPKCSLEHVTRDRVKVGATKRRPPTRIHLKEVADASADDSLRLGLEALDTGILTIVPPIPKEKDEELKPQKEPVKIPMPPTTQNNLQITEIPKEKDEELKPQKEPVKIPMPPTTQNNLQIKEIPKEKDEELKPQKEPVKIPMPPTTQNNLQIKEPSTSETTDSKVQVPHAPSPPPKILKENVYAREKLLSTNTETDMEKKSDPETSNTLSEENGSKEVSSPPKPPPKILSEKMKIKWIGSASDLMEKDRSAEKGSKENLVDFDDTEKAEKISPWQTIISNDIKIEEEGLHDKNEMESSDVDDEQHDTDEAQNDRTTEDAEEEEKDILGERDIMTDNAQESSAKSLHLTDTSMSPRLLNKTQEKPIPAERHFIERKPKASSMGDLLSDSSLDFGSKKSGSMLHLNKDRLNKVEMKLACGRQRAETLLNQVLNGQHGNTEEGNGLDVNSATLLNEVMRDLQEASEALKEIKTPQNTMPEGVTDKQKENQKDLLALHRRTVHF
ncbi:pleckstrin homology domain-containing family O member 2 [Hyla sarda]|uniref:pleckstrin homology domain-containing family O member 2 n=1 Tax=Hyla sarda TaxID=327740 RepID=UPI0024C271C7|nr:pleckstrin homology domain-containing family O member 2 [Hyla sarda]